jgi:hypothetical protein
MITPYSNTISVTTLEALLLDTYSGAAAAYSLRLLRTAYTGSAIRVRRASDNTEQDIGFVSNELDTSALTTFCSGTNGFVKTWYDQSGNARDATQTTAANQPKIVSSGSLLLMNSKPTVFFDGINDSFLLSTTIPAQNTYSLFSVGFVNNTATGNDMIIAGNTGSYGFRFDGSATNPKITITKVGIADVVSAFITGGKQTLATFLTNDTTSSVFTDSILRATSGINSPSTVIDRIGAASPSGQPYLGNMQEIVFYTSNQSTNRTGIETNINDFYSIY